MKIEIIKRKSEFYNVKLNEIEQDGLYSPKELLNAIVNMIRVNYNLTKFELERDYCKP